MGLSPESKEAKQFRLGLRDAGYSEEHDVLIDWRSANGDYDRVPELLADLIQRKVLSEFTNEVTRGIPHEHIGNGAPPSAAASVHAPTIGLSVRHYVPGRAACARLRIILSPYPPRRGRLPVRAAIILRNELQRGSGSPYSFIVAL